MASGSSSPKTRRLRAGFGKKLFRRSSRSSDSSASNSEAPRRGFDLDSIPLDAFGKLSTGEVEQHKPRIVVAIDFGTTYSGYAYSMVNSPDEIHQMMSAQMGQYGAMNNKIPTILLLNEYGAFHSFGYEAREAYHDLEESDSKRWLYFEKFKMELHSRKV
jgi:hypothetical protein